MIVGSSASAAGAEEDASVTDGHSEQADADHGVEQGTGQPDALPKDVVFGLLSAKRRRRVLEYMTANGPETTLSDLADHIDALENDTEVRLLSSQQRKRVYVALYQCHLPKMDDADVIDFDHSRGTVVCRQRADQLYAYLEVESALAGGDESSQSDGSAGIGGKLQQWLP